MQRFVVDANVLIAGLGGASQTGAPALLLGVIRDREIEAVACPTLIEEVRRGLRKPYFRARLDEEDAARELAALERLVLMADDPGHPEEHLRDPSDDYLVALARAHDAEAIITGDKDLLDHPDLRPPAILPRAACELAGVDVPA